VSDDREPYAFDGLPLNEVAPGTTLFVGGSDRHVAEEFALSLSLGAREHDEGVILLSTNTEGDKLLDRCRRGAIGDDPATLGVIECDGQPSEDERIGHAEAVSSPQDLTGLGIEFSGLYERISRGDVRKVRTGFVSVSPLLMYNDLRTVFRFLNSLTSRIAGVDGFSIFVINPKAHDDQTNSMLVQVSDGRIQVRDSETADGELRVRGLPDQPERWTPYTLPE